jgi:isoquinoline 1-oxidoreductase beta subunit
MQHDMYRPAAIARFHAALNEDGTIAAWENLSASASIAHQFTQRLLGLPGMGPDKSTAEGEYDLCYQISNQQIAHAIVHSDVPVGYWRSVGHSHNAFFKECFMDELAQTAGVDPVVFRLRHLKAGSRHEAVLRRLGDGLDKAPESHAWGVALHACFGAVVAMAALISVQDGQIRVHRIRVVADCGLVVNPNLVEQQLESGVIFGLSAALSGEITIQGGRVQQSNFHDYPVLRMNEIPRIETVLMQGGDVPQGVGEISVPPVAPAVANAVAALNGQRLRQLPLRIRSVG